MITALVRENTLRPSGKDALFLSIISSMLWKAQWTEKVASTVCTRPLLKWNVCLLGMQAYCPDAVVTQPGCILLQHPWIFEGLVIAT